MNKVILSNARLTKDLELRQANNGTDILKFSIAVAREYNREETDFINCVAFGKTAENIAKFFKKGNVIMLEGSIQTGSYENKEGTRIFTTEVLVNRFEFPLGNKFENTGNNEKSNTKMPSVDLTLVDDEDIPF